MLRIRSFDKNTMLFTSTDFKEKIFCGNALDKKQLDNL